EINEVYESPSIEHKLNYDELIKLIQQLPPSYRTVFNLYAIDGLSHSEIAEKLQITEGGSKSNLFKARRKLQKLLKKHSDESKNAVQGNRDYQYLSITK